MKIIKKDKWRSAATNISMDYDMVRITLDCTNREFREIERVVNSKETEMYTRRETEIIKKHREEICALNSILDEKLEIIKIASCIGQNIWCHSQDLEDLLNGSEEDSLRVQDGFK